MWKSLSKQQKTLLLVLCAINFFNYVDRQVIFSVLHLIKAEFLVSDFQLGLLGTVFMLVHSLSTVPLGVLGDRFPRRFLIAGGVFFWSLATAATGVATSFRGLLATRSFVGIGEAAYAPAATSAISDQIPERFWAQAQGLFNAGMLVGGTFGAALGGVVAFYYSDWRITFLVLSIPGFLLAFLASRLTDTARIKASVKSSLTEIHDLFRIPAYQWVLISGVLVTFAAAAYVSWGVEFVLRYKGYNLRDTSIILGAAMMLGGLVGVVGGSWLADRLEAAQRGGRAKLVTWSLCLAAPVMFFGFESTGGGWLFLALFFIGTALLMAYHSPSTAIMHEIVPEHLRSTAFGVYLLVLHLLGSTLAPAAVGELSDRYGLKLALESTTLLVFLAGVSFWFVYRHVRPKNGTTTNMTSLAQS